MIKNSTRLVMPNSIEYITQWVDDNGNYEIDQFVANGKVIVNKVATGCGFTTYSLINSRHTILVSPRTRLIQNKCEQISNTFYFDREVDEKGNQKLNLEQLKQIMHGYLIQCLQQKSPFKILVTYDSFNTLADMLEQELCCSISDFNIVIDEAHCIIKDVTMKEYNNKPILTRFVQRLFKYPNLLFISATPLVDYLQKIPEFYQAEISYYELEWSSSIPVSWRSATCKGALDAFDKIYNMYTKRFDTNGQNVFDAIFHSDGRADYSYECMIFLNSIKDIVAILKKYMGNLQRIDTKDVSIICAKTKKNRDRLRSVSKGLDITDSIPKEGDTHKRWTFVTRTAFAGVDFYSSNASSFVIANYNINTLSLDISTDIYQIAGRQRLKYNPFRNIINIFYKDGKMTVSDEEFLASQQNKMAASQEQIDLCQDAKPERKQTALDNLSKLIDLSPQDYYLTTMNGNAEINNLIIVSEQFCHDIIKNQTRLSGMGVGNTLNSQPVNTLMRNLPTMPSHSDRILATRDCISKYPNLMEEIMVVLCREGYANIAYYFHMLPMDRIQACGGDSWKMNQEISFRGSTEILSKLVSDAFVSGRVYSKGEVKQILQTIYDQMHLIKKAKSTDIKKYISITGAKDENGNKGYRIV